MTLANQLFINQSTNIDGVPVEYPALCTGPGYKDSSVPNLQKSADQGGD
jgi:hypothetical protein